MCAKRERDKTYSKLTDGGVRINHSLSLQFLLKEHVVGRAEVSLLEVFLVGSVAKEEMVGDTLYGIAYIID